MRKDCFLSVQTNPSQGILLLPFPLSPPFPFPVWPRVKLTVPPVKQAEWKETRTRLRTRAVGGAEVRCSMLEREACVCTITLEVC